VIRRLAQLGRWLWRLAIAAVLLWLRRGKEPLPERDLPASPRAEKAVAGLLVASGLAGAAFALIYALDEANTQLLGVAAAAALGLLAVALIVASQSVVPQEVVTEERPRFADPDANREAEVEDVALRARESVDGITRRRLLGAAGGAAALGLGAAAATPLASLGPHVGDLLRESPWRDGTPLVDENDRAVLADDLTVGGFLTAFAKGVDKRNLAASLVVVRVRPEELELPPERADWAPEGLLAFSKICTHAQCAINLFRYPLYPERSPGPALVCPCHYSTFDVLKGGERVFGPAVRPLPQLPLKTEAGRLLAAGPLSGAVGASWGGVREES
jgi:ubiquinol-cytochrome c reductase iron-sulfur subunit